MKLFLLVDRPREVGEYFKLLDELLRPGDVAHVATDINAAVRIWQPPYDVQLADTALTIPFLVDRVERLRRTT